jgi:putative cardiolipin synthase
MAIMTSFRSSLLLIIVSVLAGCAALPQHVERPVSTAYTDTQDTLIGRRVAEERRGHGEMSGYHLLSQGLDAFVARLVLADHAERSIDAQYYLLNQDVVGALFIDRLYKAAERGVRVRLLVDDIDLENREFGAAALDAHPNMEVRFFNPFSRNIGRAIQYVTGLGKQTRRAHNKSFTVDNQATILGGRNIGDEYFEANAEFSFIDLDVLVFGPLAQQVSASFDQYWNSELSYPVSALVETEPTPQEAERKKDQFDEFIARQQDSKYILHLRNSELAEQMRNDQVDYDWANGVVVADDPEKLTQDVSQTKYHLSEKLAPYLKNVRRELIIFSPYFVPGKAGLAFFKDLRDKGVQVKILTNSLASTDVGIVHAGYARYRNDLLRMGVQLYELNQNLDLETGTAEKKDKPIGGSKSSLHAKCFVLDRQTVFVGSLNLDARSVIQNTEIGVVFDAEPIARYIAEGFDRQIAAAAFRLDLVEGTDGAGRLRWHGTINGEPATFEHEPYTGFWQRFGIGFLGMLPIEAQI